MIESIDSVGLTSSEAAVDNLAMKRELLHATPFFLPDVNSKTICTASTMCSGTDFKRSLFAVERNKSLDQILQDVNCMEQRDEGILLKRTALGSSLTASDRDTEGCRVCSPDSTNPEINLLTEHAHENPAIAVLQKFATHHECFSSPYEATKKYDGSVNSCNWGISDGDQPCKFGGDSHYSRHHCCSCIDVKGQAVECNDSFLARHGHNVSKCSTYLPADIWNCESFGLQFSSQPAQELQLVTRNSAKFLNDNMPAVSSNVTIDRSKLFTQN